MISKYCSIIVAGAVSIRQHIFSPSVLAFDIKDISEDTFLSLQYVIVLLWMIYYYARTARSSSRQPAKIMP